jgi:hypothetical protein
MNTIDRKYCNQIIKSYITSECALLLYVLYRVEGDDVCCFSSSLTMSDGADVDDAADGISSSPSHCIVLRKDR